MYVASDEQTIVAQCTPRGSGALALLRLSGPHALEIADSVARLPTTKLAHQPVTMGGKKLVDQATHTVHYGWLYDPVTSRSIDQVMFIVMHAPRTFTGEHTVEITCHNNQFLVEEIIALLVRQGARIAAAGEFTRRAVDHGKIDLIQAEAIGELIHAQTQQAVKKSLEKVEGTFSAWLADIELKLLKALAWCEASFEFLDEELEFAMPIKLQVTSILQQLHHLKKSFNNQRHIKEGVRIALVGSVNAGKSSLFNLLLQQKRSIVTAIAGTTRDTVEAGLYRDGSFWTLIDTAGLRHTDDVIEQEGIVRAWQEADKADVVLIVIDSSRAIMQEEENIYCDLITKYRTKCIVVFNKSDQPSKCLFKADTAVISVSTITAEGQQALEETLHNKIDALFAAFDAPFLLNQRQYSLIAHLESSFEVIVTMIENGVQYELLSIHLRQALEHLCQLTGKSISEAGLDMVFKEFCVGK